MNTKYIVASLLVVALAAAGWFLASPLFIDRTVDEPLIHEIPVRAKVDAMDAAERQQLMSALMDQASTRPRQVDESMDQSMTETPLVVAVGRFKDADVIHKGSGRASLYRLVDGRHVIRFEDFEVTNGPALVVLMAHAVNPQSAKDVLQQGYIKLDKLKGNIGNQNYIIPSDVNVGQFRSVVIWCELFDVLFSAATLNVT